MMNIKMIYHFTTSIIMTFLILPFTLIASTLHVISIGDTNGFDSVEGKTGITNDLVNVSHLFQEIAFAARLTHHPVILTDHDVTSERIYSELDQLQVENQDIVVFYYSGHGYREQSKTKNPLANLYISKDQVGIDLGEVVQILEEKNPKILLLFVDCCNNAIPDQYAPRLIKKERFLFGNQSNFINNIKTLFLDFNGKIVAGSSLPGQYSILTSNGSFFTTSFMSHLREDLLTNSHEISWDSILSKVVLEVSAIELLGEVQVPFYEISP